MKNLILPLIVIVFLSFSCEKLLNIQPTHAIDIKVAVNSYTGLQGLLVNNYNDFQSGWAWGSAFIMLPEIMADNCEFLFVRGYYQEQYLNSFNKHIYAWIHQTINHSNIIIAHASNVMNDPGVTQGTINNLLGQAYATRAFFYFYMVNVYAYAPTAIVQSRNKGGVPLLTEPIMDLSNITFLERAKIEDVYKLMINDLNIAVDLLDNDHAANNQYGYFGKAAAQAFLSRVALYKGDWRQTVDAASAAIESGQAVFSTRESYASDWEAAVHKESFLNLIFRSVDGLPNSPRILYSSLDKNNPGFQGFGEYVPCQKFLDLLSENDIRHQVLQMGKNEHLETTKFLGNNGGLLVGNIALIRLSEVYLNRAEAYARLGLNDEAIADLDKLRQRSQGEDFIPTSSSGNELLNAIYLERRLELAFEGLRWFDLKRLGMDIDKLQTTGEIINFETDARILAPIPQQEMDLNPNMVQNEGY